MPIKVNGTTSGSVTLAAPATGSDVTLTLPGTTMDLSSELAAKAGRVIQVVNATYNTVVNTTSSTYTTTNLTVNITPSSATNKILVIVFQAGIGKDTSSGSSVLLKLFRDATELALFEGAAAYTASTATNYVGSAGITYLDSPATTSAVTYSTKFASGDNSGNAGVQKNSARSTITVMEISA